MGWATKHIQDLKEGKIVKCRPHGNSMKGLIESGQLCTLEPVLDTSTIQEGDIVLCRVNGNQYIHLVTAVQGNRVQISNNKNHINGWTTAVYGKCVKVED